MLFCIGLILYWFKYIILEVSQSNHFIDSSAEAIDILTTSLGEVWLTTTTTLDELSGFAHHLTSIQPVVAHHIVAHHDGELGLVVFVRTDDA